MNAHRSSPLSWMLPKSRYLGRTESKGKTEREGETRLGARSQPALVVCAKGEYKRKRKKEDASHGSVYFSILFSHHAHSIITLFFVCPLILSTTKKKQRSPQSVCVLGVVALLSYLSLGALMSRSAENAAKLGKAAFDGGEKVSSVFFAVTYGALVQQLLAGTETEGDVASVNQQLDACGHRIGARLVEDFSVRSGAPPCRSFAQAAESAALIGLRMFLNMTADVSPVKDSADTFAITFLENPLALFVELPEGPIKEKLCYSNVLCGVLCGALSLVGFQTEVRFARDRLRGDACNEITIRFKGRERETFQVEKS